MWRESLEQIPRMWRDEPYEFEGKYFRMPKRNVLPKPYSKPHPPMWVACSSPPTFAEAGELGLGALCFTFGTPTRDRRARQELQGRRSSAARSRSAATSTTTSPSPPTCSASRTATRRAHLYCRRQGRASSREYFFNWLDSIPRPQGFPQGRPGRRRCPPPTPERAEGRARRRRPADRLAGGDHRGHQDVRGRSASTS